MSIHADASDFEKLADYIRRTDPLVTSLVQMALGMKIPLVNRRVVQVSTRKYKARKRRR